MNKTFLMLMAVACLAGCTAGKEFVYEPDSESPPGKGLLSGDDGVFTLYEKTGEPKAIAKEDPQPAGADVKNDQ